MQQIAPRIGTAMVHQVEKNLGRIAVGNSMPKPTASPAIPPGSDTLNSAAKTPTQPQSTSATPPSASPSQNSTSTSAQNLGSDIADSTPHAESVFATLLTAKPFLETGATFLFSSLRMMGQKYIKHYTQHFSETPVGHKLTRDEPSEFLKKFREQQNKPERHSRELRTRGYSKWGEAESMPESDKGFVVTGQSKSKYTSETHQRFPALKEHNSSAAFDRLENTPFKNMFEEVTITKGGTCLYGKPFESSHMDKNFRLVVSPGGAWFTHNPRQSPRVLGSYFGAGGRQLITKDGRLKCLFDEMAYRQSSYDGRKPGQPNMLNRPKSDTNALRDQGLDWWEEVNNGFIEAAIEDLLDGKDDIIIWTLLDNAVTGGSTFRKELEKLATNSLVYDHGSHHIIAGEEVTNKLHQGATLKPGGHGIFEIYFPAEKPTNSTVPMIIQKPEDALAVVDHPQPSGTAGDSGKPGSDSPTAAATGKPTASKDVSTSTIDTPEPDFISVSTSEDSTTGLAAGETVGENQS